MEPVERVVLAAIAGALIWYGVNHRHKRIKVNNLMDRKETNPEGWLAIGIGALLLLGALLSRSPSL